LKEEIRNYLTARAMKHPVRFAVAMQLIAGLAVLMVIAVVPTVVLYPLALAGLQGTAAAVLSWLIGMPSWWWWIGGGFVPMAYLLADLGISPSYWLAGFVLLALVFWRTDTSRVPLYMSNSMTVEALSGLLPHQSIKFIDLGCGDGRLLRQLARLRPDCLFVGYEHAPLTWAWARLFGFGLKNLDIRYGSFWAHSLASYDVIYAFLSPAPMPKLWIKALEEMPPRALLISNSFPVPGVRARQTHAVSDKRRTILYCYAVGGTT
jgi:hypothetical protein